MKIPNKRELQQIALNHLLDIAFKDFMKLYKDHTKEPFVICSERYNFSTRQSIKIQEEPITKWLLAKKSKHEKKIEQIKAQYNLDRQTAKISTLSSGNVAKYEFLTRNDILS